MANTTEPELDVPRIAAVLNRHGVAYLLVGGVAAGVHGAIRPTQDVDCLVDRDGDNLTCLAAAMRELNARLRVAGLDDAESALLATVVDGLSLARMEISTWRTDAGNFDVLTDIPDRDGRRRPYGELAARAQSAAVGEVVVVVAALDDVIASKEWADRPKDREALPELRALWREQLAAADHEQGEATSTPPDAGPALGEGLGY
ncbi:MAG: hypothetical protein ABIW46_04920 [Acidimicrobiales bacterium]